MPIRPCSEVYFHYIRSPDMDMWGDMAGGGIWGVWRDTAGYNEIYSGMQRDMGDTAGYSGIQQDTAGYSRIQRDTAGYSAGYSGILKKYTPEHGSYATDYGLRVYRSSLDKARAMAETAICRLPQAELKLGRAGPRRR